MTPSQFDHYRASLLVGEHGDRGHRSLRAIICVAPLERTFEGARHPTRVLDERGQANFEARLYAKQEQFFTWRAEFITTKKKDRLHWLARHLVRRDRMLEYFCTGVRYWQGGRQVISC